MAGPGRLLPGYAARLRTLVTVPAGGYYPVPGPSESKGSESSARRERPAGGNSESREVTAVGGLPPATPGPIKRNTNSNTNTSNR
eukprot:1424234-Rhodomonas_salina.3